MNKTRPSAYINFSAQTRPTMTVGDRGIGTMAIPLNWGPEGELIDVYSTDMMDGSSLAKVGMTAFDAEALKLNLMLSNCYLTRVYRLDSGGVQAAGTGGNLTAKATYPGTKGNLITIQIVAMSDGFRVLTYISGTEVDRQDALTVQDLVNNNFVEFSGFGDLVANAGITLSGGTNGTYTPASAYPAYLALARKANWQVMALTQDNDTFAAQFATFADQMRYDEGKFVQVVVANYDAADSVSVINSDCGAVVDGVTVTAEEATAWVAGITAGASITQSNISKVFSGATRILHERTNAEIIAALEKGMFILSTNQRGEIVVEDDINSLHTFTAKLSKDMRINQVIRVLDEIGTSITDTWEQSFKGKVQNNADGRGIYKATLLSYFNDIQNLGAIENFAGADDITVDAGVGKGDVTLTIDRLDVVAAMSTLYALVYMI